MLTNPNIVATISALLLALLNISYRAFLAKNPYSAGLTFLNSLGGGILIALFLPSLEQVYSDLPSLALLVFAGALWGLAVYFELKSFEFIDASLNAILNASRVILLCGVGVYFFSERYTYTELSGSVLIILAIVISITSFPKSKSPGLMFRALAIILSATATTLDKYLTTKLPFEYVVFAGYFVPAICFILLSPKVLKGSIHLLRKHPGPVLLTTVLYAGMGFGFTFGYAKGDLGATLLIQQCHIIITFILGVWLLKERTNVTRRGIGAALATLGAFLLIADDLIL